MRLSLRSWQGLLALLGWRPRNRRQRKAHRRRFALARRRSVVRRQRFDTLEKRVVMNADPVGVDDEFAASLNSTALISKGALTANDTDVEQNVLTVAAHDAFTTQGVAVSFNAAGEFTYAAPNGFVGDDSFSYTVSDGNGGTSQARATIHVTNPQNVAPVIVTGTTRVPTLGPIAQGIAAADNLGTSVAELTTNYRDILTNPDGATPGIAITGADNTNGTWQYSVNGGTTWANVGTRSTTSALLLSTAEGNRVRFQPTSTFYGTKSLTIRLWDGSNGLASGTTASTSSSGGTTAYSTATIDAKLTVQALPKAINLNAVEDVAASNVYLVSDLAANAPGGPAQGIAIVTDFATGSTGTWEYQLTSGGSWMPVSVGAPYPGTDEWIQFRSYSGNPQFSLNVTGYSSVTLVARDNEGNQQRLDAVFGVGNVNVSEQQGEYYQMDVSFGGALAKQNIDWSISNVQGSVSSYTIQEGWPPSYQARLLTADAATRIRFTPNSPYSTNYNGVMPNVLALRWWDGTNAAANGTRIENYLLDSAISGTNVLISRTVAAANDAPTTVSGTLTTTEDRAVSVYGSDIDGDLLTYTVVSGPANGTLTVEYGKLTYKPKANYFGSDSFQYKVGDGQAESATRTVSVTVSSANDAPSFQAGGDVTVDEDSGAYNGSWATGLSKGPTNESAQTLSWLISNNNTSLFAVQPTLSATGVLTFTPAANKNGVATVIVRLKDNGGTSSGGFDTSVTRTFTITVAPVVDPTIAGPDNLIVAYDTPRQIPVSTLLQNDASPDGNTLTISGYAGDGPEHGELTFSNGIFTYTPAEHFIGVDSFEYVLHDGASQTNVVVWLEVGPLVATAVGSPLLVTNEDQPLDLQITRDRVDGVQVTHFRLTTSAGVLFQGSQSLASQPIVAAADALAGFQFRPASDWNGTAVINVEAGFLVNGVFGAVKSFNVTVNPVNDPPTLVVAPGQFTTGTSQTVDLGGYFNFADVDSARHKITVSTPHGGVLHSALTEPVAEFTLTASKSAIAAVLQSLRYRSPSDYAGTTEIVITIWDVDASDEPLDEVTRSIGVQILPTLSVSGAATVGEADGQITFTVALALASDQEVSVNWFRSGSAQDGTDVVGPASGTLVFAPGELTKTLSWSVVDDVTDELTKYLSVDLLSPVNAYVGTSYASTALVDDDDPPNLSGALAEVGVNEDGTVVTVRVTLSAPSERPVTFHWRPSDGTAIRPDDWTQGYWVNEYEQVWVDTSHEETHWVPDSYTSQWVPNLVNYPYWTGDYYDGEGNLVPGHWENNWIDEGSYQQVLDVPGHYETVWVTEGHYEDGAVIGGYWNDGGYVTINPGDTEATISIQINDDDEDEDDETFTVQLSQVVNAVLVEPSQVTITIVDDERNHAPKLLPTAVHALADVTEDTLAAENSGTLVADLIADAVTDLDDDALGIAVVGADSTSGAWQFDLGLGSGWQDFGAELSDASALLLAGDARVRYLPAADFSAVGAQRPTLTFRAWDRSNEATDELNGTRFDVSAFGGSSPFSSALGISAVTVTPVNDAPVNAGPTTAAAAEDVTFVFSAAGGNALSVSDVDGDQLTVTLSVAHGTLSLGDGVYQATRTIEGTPQQINAALSVVQYRGAANYHGSDVLTMTTSDGELSDVKTVSVTVAAVNDAPSISLPSGVETSTSQVLTFGTAGGNAVTVGDDEAGTLSVTVAVDHGALSYGGAQQASSFVFTGTAAAINLALNGLKFHAPSDYAGPATLTVTAADEDQTGGGPQSSTATASIRIRPRITIGDGAANEATGTMVFTVTLSAASDESVTVGWQTQNGTANTWDYTAAQGTLTFAPGQTTKTVTIALTNDARDEDDQTFQVNLLNPTNAVIHDGTGVGTIVDDDAPPVITVVSREVRERDGEIQIHVQLSHASEKTVSVQWNPADGTAVRLHEDWLIGDWTQGYYVPAQSTETWVDTSAWETFWVDTSHWEDVWVDDEYGDIWIDTSYQSWDWVDTSHYESVWVDTSGYEDVWVPFDVNYPVWIEEELDGEGNVIGGGYYEDNWVDEGGYEQQWVESGYYEDQWVESGEYPWISDGYYEYGLITPAHFETQWIEDGYEATEWVESGYYQDEYWGGYWVDGDVLTFTPGTTDKIISATVIDDEETEDDEQFHIWLSNAVNASIAQHPSGTITILANDHAPTATNGDVSVSLRAGEIWTSSTSGLVSLFGVTDAEGESLTLSFEPGATAHGSIAALGGGLAYTASSLGDDVVTLQLVDPEGKSLSVTLTFSIRANAAPVLNPLDVADLSPIVEDALSAANVGTLVADLLAEAADDFDGDTLGIALIDADFDYGTWQFQIGAGAAWTTIESTLGESHALLLFADSSTRVRFVPNVNFHTAIADAPTLRFRAWDRTNDPAALRNGTYGDASVGGGESPFSDQIGSSSIEVSPVNDAPTFNVGDDITVSFSGEAYEFVAFLSQLSRGPIDEIGQELTITVTNDNPELFTEDGQPTIDEDGKLTFKAAFAGNAFVTVKVQDDGGTSDGGVDTLTKTFWIEVTPNLSGGSSGGSSGGTSGGSQSPVPDAATQANWLQELTIVTGRGSYNWNQSGTPVMDRGDTVELVLELRESELPGRRIQIAWADSTPTLQEFNVSGSSFTQSHVYGSEFALSRTVEVAYYEGTELRGAIRIPIAVFYTPPTLSISPAQSVEEGEELTLSGVWTSFGPAADISIKSAQPGWLQPTTVQKEDGTFSSTLKFNYEGTYDVIVDIWDGVSRVRRYVSVTVAEKEPEITWHFEAGQGIAVPSAGSSAAVPATIVDPGTDDYYQFVLQIGTTTTATEWARAGGEFRYPSSAFEGLAAGAYTGTLKLLNGAGAEISSRGFTIQLDQPIGAVDPQPIEGVYGSLSDNVASEAVTLRDGRVVKDRALFHIQAEAGTTVEYFIVRTGTQQEDLATAAEAAKSDLMVSTDGSTFNNIANGTVTIASGRNSAVLYIEGKQDELVELDEEYQIWLRVVGEEQFHTGSEFVVVLHDSQADVEFGSNNVDTASTGLMRESVWDGYANVDLYDGRRSWDIPWASDIPTFYGGYSAWRIDSLQLPAEGLWTHPWLEALNAADLPADTKLATPYLDRSTQEIDYGQGHRLLRSFQGGVGDLAFWDPQYENDRLGGIDPNPGVGGYSAGYVDRLIPVGYDGIDYGFLLLRRDGTSAWYKAAAQGGKSVEPLFEIPGLFGTPDSNGIRKATGGTYSDVRWVAEGLDSNRIYQVFAPLPSGDGPRAGVEGPAPAFSTVRGTQFVGTGVSGVDYDNQQRYSLGWFRPDASGTIELTRLGGDFISNLTFVDSWTFTTPDGSLATMETLPDGTGTDDVQFRLKTNNGLTFEFDGLGLMVAEEDRLGNRREFAYVGTEDDGWAARLETVTAQGNLVTRFGYSANLELATITDPHGRVTSFVGGTIVSTAPTENPTSGAAQSVRIVGIGLTNPAGINDLEPTIDAEVHDLIHWTYDVTLKAQGNITSGNTENQIAEAAATFIRQRDAGESEADATWRYQFDRFGLTTAKQAPVVDGAAEGDVWKWERDKHGRIDKVISPAGRGDDPIVPENDVIDYVYYQTTGLLWKIVYADSSFKEWTYGAYNQVATYKDRSGRQTRYELNADGTVKDQFLDGTDDLKTTFTYTARPTSINELAGGLVRTATDADGRVKTYAYYEDRTVDGAGKFGRVKSITYSQSGNTAPLVETFDYDRFGNLVEHVDVNMVVTHRRYDNIGQLLETRVGSERNVATGELTGGTLLAFYTYDGAGNLTSKSTPTGDGTPGNTTLYEYDYWNRLKKVTEPVAQGQYTEAPVTEYKYTVDGLVKEIKKADGLVTTYEYDARRRKIKETIKGDSQGLVKRGTEGTSFTETVSEWTYDAADNIKSFEDSLKRLTYFTYDADGRLLSTKSPDPDGDGEDHGPVVTRTEYDQAGRIIKKHVPSPSGGETVTTHIYDDAGRLRRVQQPATEQAQGAALSKFTAYEYNVDGSVKKQHSGVTINYPSTFADLTVDGVLMGSGDHVQLLLEYEYDARGRVLVTRTDDLTDSVAAFVSRVEFEIIDDVLVETRIDAKQNETKITYDAQGRVVRIESPAPDAQGSQGGALPALLTIREYYASGQLKTETQTYVGGENDPKRKTASFTYDEAGRVRTVSKAGLTATYTYDQLGRVAEERLGDGTTKKSQYNNRGQLTRSELHDVASSGQGILSWTEFTYDESGAVSKQQNHENVTTTFTRDALDRVTQQTVEYVAAARTLTTTTTYNNAGLVTEVSDGLKTTGFFYDAAGRKRFVTETADGSSRTTTTVYDDLLRQQIVTDAMQNSTTIGFDALGRKVLETMDASSLTGMLSTHAPAASYSARQFEYDANGNLTRYTNHDGDVIVYEYDDLNRIKAEYWTTGTGTAASPTYVYKYDNLGNLAFVEGKGSNIAYSDFDKQGRAGRVDLVIDPFGEYGLQYGLDYDYEDRLPVSSGDSSARSSYSVALYAQSTLQLTHDFRFDAMGRIVEAKETTPEGRDKRVSFQYQDSDSDPIQGISSRLITTIQRYELPGANAAERLGVKTEITSAMHNRALPVKITHKEGDRTLDWGNYGYDSHLRLASYEDESGTLVMQRSDYSDFVTSHNGLMRGSDDGIGTENNTHFRAISDGRFSYTYDYEGNVTERTEIASGLRTNYEYDHRNRLTRVTETRADNAVVLDVTLHYDPLDRLVMKRVVRENEQFVERKEVYVYDGANRIAQFDQTSAERILAKRYLFTPDGRELAEELVDPVAAQRAGGVAGQVLWVLADQQGSTMSIASFNAAQGQYEELQDLAYNGVGEAQASLTGAPMTLALFAGRAYDAQLQMYDYGGRMYDARAGRFANVELQAGGVGANPYQNGDLRGPDYRIGDLEMRSKSTAKAEVGWFGKMVGVEGWAGVAEAGGRALQFLGGVAQFVGGAFLTFGTFGWGTPIGGLAMASGFDDMYHAVTGTDSWKNRTAQAFAKSLGASDRAAWWAGMGADIVGGSIGGGAAAAKVGRLFGRSSNAAELAGKIDNVAPSKISAQIRRTDFDGLEGFSQVHLAEFGEAIAGNSRASSLYNQVSRYGTQVDLDFGPIMRNGAGNPIVGLFDDTVAPGRISVFARAQRSMDEAVGTFAHEARHALDARRGLPSNTQGSEYRAFVEAFIVRQGRTPNRIEMGTIAREVKSLYPHLSADSRINRISGY